MQKLKDMKIKKRLNTGFKMVTGIATIAAVLGIIAMLVASGRYEYAMTNYGFSQGDIGMDLVSNSSNAWLLPGVNATPAKGMIAKTPKMVETIQGQYWRQGLSNAME